MNASQEPFGEMAGSSPSTSNLASRAILLEDQRAMRDRLSATSTYNDGASAEPRRTSASPSRGIFSTSAFFSEATPYPSKYIAFERKNVRSPPATGSSER